MTEMNVVIGQVVEFFILMAAGFIAGKCGVLTKPILEGVMKVIVKILLPCLIFTVVAGSGVSIQDYIENIGFAAAVLIGYGAMLAAGIISGKLMRLKDATYNVYVAESTFGDMGFIGIPLLMTLFGDARTSIAISVYTVIDMALLWTLGVYLCGRHEKSGEKKNTWRYMISPTSVALVLGLLFVISGISLPGMMINPIKTIGSASTPLALIYIGGMLSFVSFVSLVKKFSVVAIIVVKMTVLPIAVFALSRMFFDMQGSTTLMYMVGLPAMTTVSMLAQLYGSDYEYANAAVFITTLACLGTLPLISFAAAML